MLESYAKPTLVVALALVAGMLAQIVARHIGIPGIVLLLAVGVALGPDAIGIIQPDTLGDALLAIVNFSVAVILFEGALGLNLRRIHRLGRPIRRLLTLGALVTAALSSLIAYFVLGFTVSNSLLFGSLVIVTGPTVINPLLRRLRVERGTATILEAEGVFIDAIGAIVAVVIMEIVTEPVEPALGTLQFAGRFGVGSVIGLVGGAFIAWLFRSGKLIPHGLQNVTALSIALAVFQVSGAIMPESGIVAVIAAGLVVGNLQPRLWRELRDFNEQLTVLLIGLLFVLLAADVRLSSVYALGAPGLLAVGLLLFVVRPLAVFTSTYGSDLNTRQRAFISMVGPRGIVAAAVASVFANQLEAHAMPGGQELRAMVFLTIVLSVLTAGLMGGPLARWLRLDRPRNRGWVILGANPLARELAAIMMDSGAEVICIDSNPGECRKAEARGLRVIYGNGLDELTLKRAEIDVRAGAIGLTRSEEVNYLFLTSIHNRERDLKLYIALNPSDKGVTPGMLDRIRAEVFAGRGYQVELWNSWLESGEAHVERFRRSRVVETASRSGGIARHDEDRDRGLLLPLVIHNSHNAQPSTDASVSRAEDEVSFVIRTSRREQAERELAIRGFEPISRISGPAPSTEVSWTEGGAA